MLNLLLQIPIEQVKSTDTALGAGAVIGAIFLLIIGAIAVLIASRKT